ncbi:MAG: hypothetical protein Q9163_001280 [Psora crenata]
MTTVGWPAQLFLIFGTCRCITTLNTRLGVEKESDTFIQKGYLGDILGTTPFVEKTGTIVRVDNGLGEWYGRARFDHPSPATLRVLQGLFSWVDETWKPSIIPSASGETIEELHDRCAFALQYLLTKEDEDDYRNETTADRSILICTHAASLIAIGRVLTGRMPDDLAEEDFLAFTAGISKFTRRTLPTRQNQAPVKKWEKGEAFPEVDWKNDKGVAGGWDCVVNGDCSHLQGGQERGW